MELMLLKDKKISYFSALQTFVKPNTIPGSKRPSMVHLIVLSTDEIKENDLENNSINDSNAGK
jgi:hypothetical protein